MSQPPDRDGAPADGAARDGLGIGPPASRPLLWVQLAGVVLFALVSVVMTVTGVTILVTDGAAVEQDGAGWGEVGWTVVFGGLAVVLTRAALHLRRQLRA